MSAGQFKRDPMSKPGRLWRRLRVCLKLWNRRLAMPPGTCPMCCGTGFIGIEPVMVCMCCGGLGVKIDETRKLNETEK